jgi:hypothetical protein
MSPIDEQTVQATERPRLVPHEPDVWLGAGHEPAS